MACSADPGHPRPRHPKSPAQAARIRLRNRRREYLERNPEYFESLEHELADPLLYDSLIRRFQSPAEREADGKAKGYARTLESSLLRGETRLETMAAEYRNGAGSSSSSGGTEVVRNGSSSSSCQQTATMARETSFGLEIDLTPAPSAKEAGLAQWEAFLRDRFVNGGDDDFEYALVDEDDSYDVMERRDREDEWFDDETPDWVSTGGSAAGEAEGSEVANEEKKLEGETGVQDF